MAELFANNAASTLASSILAGDLSLTVATGEGALFPSPSGGDYFHATLDDGVNIEIVRVTARSSDTLTIVRAQQGTAAAGFGAGTAVQIRITASTLTRFEGGIGSYTGFSAGAAAGDRDYYLAGSDLLNVPAFTLTALVRIYGNSGLQYIAGSTSEFSDAHWLGLNSDEVHFQALDSSGAGFTANWFEPAFYGRWLLLSGVKLTFGSDWSARLFANGGQVGENYQPSGGGARATNAFSIGASFNGEGGACDALRIAWVSLAFRGITATEQQEWWESIIEAGGSYVSPPSGVQDHLWVLDGTPGSTLVDSIGSADLTRTGSAATLTGVRRKFLV